MIFDHLLHLIIQFDSLWNSKDSMSPIRNRKAEYYESYGLTSSTQRIGIRHVLRFCVISIWLIFFRNIFNWIRFAPRTGYPECWNHTFIYIQKRNDRNIDVWSLSYLYISTHLRKSKIPAQYQQKWYVFLRLDASHQPYDTQWPLQTCVAMSKQSVHLINDAKSFFFWIYSDLSSIDSMRLLNLFISNPLHWPSVEVRPIE